MHTSILSRSVIAIASLAIGTAALAVPAEASEPAPKISRAAVAKFVDAHGAVRIGPADAEFEEFIRQLETLSSTVCQAVGPDASIVLLDIAEAQNVSSLMISADIDADGFGELDTTCTYAMIFTDEGLTFTGRYAMDVTSSMDPVTHRAAGLSSDLVLTEPVFTDVEEYAQGNLTATGKTLKPATRWVNAKVKKAKTAKQKKAAKKKYQSAVKSAKKKYTKAGKTKKAKKTMTKSIARAKKAYKKAVAPSTKTVRKLQKYNIETPFSLSAVLNGYDDIRPA